MILDRSQIRQSLRSARRNLSDEAQSLAAHALLTQFQMSFGEKVTPSSKIALYLSNDGEISPEWIARWCWDNHIPVYLPVLNGQALLFAKYEENSQWQKNSFNILEPIDPKPLTGQEMDIVLMPLVGFDAQGGRLGMGGGFYDRTFENQASKTSLYGLAHDCQEVSSLPIESWDVPLQGILTSTRYIHCKS